MLVLSRKKDQSIQIDNVVITVKQVKNKKVTLGIEAPMDVKIIRGELVNEETFAFNSNAGHTDGNATNGDQKVRFRLPETQRDVRKDELRTVVDRLRSTTSTVTAHDWLR